MSDTAANLVESITEFYIKSGQWQEQDLSLLKLYGINRI